MMKKDWKHLDAASLKTLYERELQALHAALLSGAAWEDVQDQRHLLVELSKHLSKVAVGSNPAEHPNRTG